MRLRNNLDSLIRSLGIPELTVRFDVKERIFFSTPSSECYIRLLYFNLWKEMKNMNGRNEDSSFIQLYSEQYLYLITV